MINVSEIRKTQPDGMFGVIGLRQPYNPTYAILESALIASSSGEYFDQYSSYITVENIKETQPYGDITNANFNAWLTDKIKDSITKSLRRCFNKEELIENALLYQYSNRKTDEIDNDGDFVGFEIIVGKKKELASFINSVFTEFSGIGSVKLLLFNDSQTSPLQTETITVSTEDKSATKKVLNWILPYANTVTGGKFYVGYLNSGLTLKALNRDYELANIRHRYKGLRIEPIKVPGHNSETLFDIDLVDYTDETWGLNFDISTYRDYTSYILNNKDMFLDVIGYQFAADMLGMMVSSTRTNGIERLQKGNLLIELQGNTTNDELPTVIGVQSKLKKAIEKVQKQLVNDPLISVDTLQ